MSIGTMLNGWRVYLPGIDGRPLVNGRVSFYNAGTADDTELEAEVFADKELSKTLGTVVYADDTGMLPAIWLSRSHLYKAVVERLVSRFPTEVWEPLYEIDDIGDVDATEPTIFTPARVCDTIGDMAKLPWSDLDGFVEVLGVNYPYDAGSPLVFKWNETSAEDNLGYAFVKPYGYQQAGRWEQVFNEGFIDVRKFGAFPGGGADVLSQIIHALRYASNVTYVRNPVTVSFASAGDYGIGGDIDFSAFKYNGAHVNVSICDGARFVNASTLGNVELKISPNTRIESGREIVGDYVDLVFDEDSVEYIRPQWFHSENGIFAEQLYRAAKMDCNPYDIPVYVYGKVYAEGRQLPEFKATARIIWGDTSFVFSDAGSPQRGLFEASAGFECNSRIVFDLDKNSLWQCKFNDVSEIDSRWVSSLQVVLDSAVEPSQVIRVHGTTVTGSVSNNSSRVLVDGVIKIANDATLTIGSVVNDLNHKIFDILPASQGHSRGRVFTLADKVSVDWFAGSDAISKTIKLDNYIFNDIINSADENASIYFRTTATIEGNIESSGAKRSFVGMDLRGGNLKLSYNYLDVTGCKFNNVSIEIEAKTVKISDNYIYNSYVRCKSENGVFVTNNRFGGENLVNDIPLTIEAPRSCMGAVSGNEFSECDKIAKYIPVEDEDDLMSLHSGIAVTRNSAINESSLVYDRLEMDFLLDYERKSILIDDYSSSGPKPSVSYIEFTIPNLSYLKSKLFDKEGKFVVSLGGLKIGPTDKSNGGVHCFGISEFKSVSTLDDLESRTFKIVYATDRLENFALEDFAYVQLRAAGFFDEYGTTLYATGKLYHSLSGDNRMFLWINVCRGNE